MFLHNSSATMLSWVVFFIKPSIGKIAYKLYEKAKKDKFNPKDKIPTKIFGLYKQIHMELINLLNSTYMLIGVFTLLQLYDITNLEW